MMMMTTMMTMILKVNVIKVMIKREFFDTYD